MILLWSIQKRAYNKHNKKTIFTKIKKIQIHKFLIFPIQKEKTQKKNKKEKKQNITDLYVKPCHLKAATLEMAGFSFLSIEMKISLSGKDRGCILCLLHRLERNYSGWRWCSYISVWIPPDHWQSCFRKRWIRLRELVHRWSQLRLLPWFAS